MHKNMQNSLPICRVCLTTSLEYIDFETPFKRPPGEEESLEEVPNDATGIAETTFTYSDCFRLCTGIAVDESEGASLCDGCAMDLKNTYEFIHKAVKSHQRLQESAKGSEITLDSCEEFEFYAAEAEYLDEMQSALHSENSCSDTPFIIEKTDMENVADKSSIYECPHCHKKLMSQFVLNLHMDLHHNKTTPEEDVSSEENSNMQDDDLPDSYDELDDILIDEILNTSDDEMKVEHELEDNEVGNPDDPTTQKKMDRNESYNEDVPAHNKAKRQKTSKKASSAPPPTCKVCLQQIGDNETMLTHVQNTHWHIVQCTMCEYKGKEAKMSEHMSRVHVGLSDFLCNICPKTFTSLGMLNAHLKYHKRKESKSKSDACKYCGKTFSTQHYLRQHLDVHRQERDLFQCKQCDKAYVSKSTLENHERIHRGETMDCGVCGKQFSRQYELNVHMRFHTGDYPFECTVCHRKFAIKGHLRTHMWRHQGLKLQCEECGKLFTSSKALQEHSFTHTEMPFPCSYCSRGYPSKQKYRSHLKTAHMVDLDEAELSKIPQIQSRRPLFRKKLTLVQADSVMKEVEIKSKEDSADDELKVDINPQED